jgi:hypothetical protein
MILGRYVVGNPRRMIEVDHAPEAGLQSQQFVVDSIFLDCVLDAR